MSLSEALSRNPATPVEINQRKMDRGTKSALIFVGAAAVALTVFLLVRNVWAKGKAAVSGDGTMPTPGPSPIPPKPPVQSPTPDPVQPKTGQPAPSWADPNPYGFNAQPGDPYVSPTSLWISEDCSRWKMGSQWFPEVGAPIIQGWIDVGWDATNPDDDVYTLVGTAFAWGWEVGRMIVKPYLEQSNPQGPLCTEGFKWPWDTRDFWRVASGEYDQAAGEWVWTCPAGYGTQPEGLGRVCVQPSVWTQWEESISEFQADFPALFNETLGLYGLIWYVWVNLSSKQPWNAGAVQANLDSLRLNSP